MLNKTVESGIRTLNPKKLSSLYALKLSLTFSHVSTLCCWHGYWESRMSPETELSSLTALHTINFLFIYSCICLCTC